MQKTPNSRSLRTTRRHRPCARDRRTRGRPADGANDGLLGSRQGGERGPLGDDLHASLPGQGRRASAAVSWTEPQTWSQRRHAFVDDTVVATVPVELTTAEDPNVGQDAEVLGDVLWEAPRALQRLGHAASPLRARSAAGAHRARRSHRESGGRSVRQGRRQWVREAGSVFPSIFNFAIRTSC